MCVCVCVCVCVCITDHFAVQEKLTQHCKPTIHQMEKKRHMPGTESVCSVTAGA